MENSPSLGGHVTSWVRTAAPAILLGTITVAHLPGQTVIVYDHAKQCTVNGRGESLPLGCAKQITVTLEPGDPFTIEVRNTSASAFTYSIRGYAAEQETRAGTQPGGAKGLEAVDTVRLSSVHDKRYGGYVLTISHKDGGPLTSLAPAVLIVAVPPTRKPYAFSGGLSLTSVRSDAFVVRKEIDTIGTSPLVTDTVHRVRTDPARRDAASVGFATFATVNLPRVLGASSSWLNLAVGVGIETKGETQYYFGLGGELHPGVFLNAGYVLGRVNALPAGIRVGDVVADANALANLSKRSKGGLFVGLSFTFLGGGQEAFGKPFAGSEK